VSVRFEFEIDALRLKHRTIAKSNQGDSHCHKRKVDQPSVGARFELSSRRAGTALAERPGQPYPATFRLLSDRQFSLSRLGPSMW
jgi:hypothetical protein